jgi:hypothetical protein
MASMVGGPVGVASRAVSTADAVHLVAAVEAVLALGVA